MGVIKTLSSDLPLDALYRIFNSFVRPNMDYGAIIYDKPTNESFKNKIESIQYITITETILETSKKRLYQEMGLEFLRTRADFENVPFY